MSFRIPLPLLYTLALAVPLLATFLLTPAAAWVARRFDVLDQPGDHKVHQRATPYLGGLAVGIGLLLVAGISGGVSGQILMVALGAIGLSLLGLMDDQRLVGPWLKVLVEAAAGLALWMVGIRAGLFGDPALDLVLTVLWVVAVTNAINMLDNMDGLASGVTAVSAFGFFAIAAMEGDYLVASLSLAVVGACLGFLPHNFPPARIFLGDAGTLCLGFLLAALGLKLDLVGERGLIRSAIPVLALGVPIFDAAVAVVARIREGRPIYVGGIDHLSHRLAGVGLTPVAVAVVFYATQGALSVMAVVLLDVSSSVALAIVVGLGSLAGVGVLAVQRITPIRPVVLATSEPSANREGRLGSPQRDRGRPTRGGRVG
ncbi:MAG: glycosyltransferase family 4 protein [Actinomycetota bacterium]